MHKILALRKKLELVESRNIKHPWYFNTFWAFWGGSQIPSIHQCNLDYFCVVCNTYTPHLPLPHTTWTTHTHTHTHTQTSRGCQASRFTGRSDHLSHTKAVSVFSKDRTGFRLFFLPLLNRAASFQVCGKLWVLIFWFLHFTLICLSSLPNN